MSGVDGDGGGDIDVTDRPERDLLDRYERMVQTQVDTLNGIDEKAATTMRIVAVLLGVLLSLLTLFNREMVAITTETIVPVAWVSGGIVALLVSLGGCLYTYLGSRLLFGPSPELGTVLAEHRVERDDYESNLLRGYSAAIRTNREVIRTNSRRFRNTLLMMIYGVLGVSMGLGLYILSSSLIADLLISAVVLVLTAVSSHHILEERYMVLPHED